jgi:hypothetical protein
MDWRRLDGSNRLQSGAASFVADRSPLARVGAFASLPGCVIAMRTMQSRWAIPTWASAEDDPCAGRGYHSVMTAIMAIRSPSKGLNPKRLRVELAEEGIVMVADTRIMTGSHPLPGHGLKLGGLSERVIAAFAGEVHFADRALSLAADNIQGLTAAADIAAIVQGSLRSARALIERKRRLYATTVLIGIWTDSAPHLYVVDSSDNFDLRLRDGPEYAGSGRTELRKNFESNLDWMTSSWDKRAKQKQFELTESGPGRLLPDDGRGFPVRLADWATLAVMSLDELINQATIQSVGGLHQVLCLTRQGIAPLRVAKSSDAGETWSSITPELLRAGAMGITARTATATKKPL